MSDAICRTLGLGTSASERAACRLLEQRGSEPERYISAAEQPQLDQILRDAPADVRPRIANALLNGLARPGGHPARVTAGGGLEPMLRAAAQPAPARSSQPNEYQQLMEYGMQRHVDGFKARTTGTIMATGGGLTAAASVGGIAAITAGVITAPAWVPVALGVTAVVGTGVAIWGAVKMMTW